MPVYEIDYSELKDLNRKLKKHPKEARNAMRSAVNRTISRIVTNTAKEVKKEYPAIIRKDIKETLNIEKATLSNLTGIVESTGSRLRASKFPHKISRKRNRSPVSVKIKGSYKTSGNSPVMFGEGVGGNRGARGREIYKREGKTAETVYTLSIPQMISNENVYKAIADDASEFLVKRFEHEYYYRINKQ